MTLAGITFLLSSCGTRASEKHDSSPKKESVAKAVTKQAKDEAINIATEEKIIKISDNKTTESEVHVDLDIVKENMIETTDSGLQYEILNAATDENAASPKPGQVVMVHYTGWLDDSNPQETKFDSSVDRGQPFLFPIGMRRVIAGWDEGVLSMKVGEKRKLIIPAELGYGQRGAGNMIPPNATLYFEVELLGIQNT